MLKWVHRFVARIYKPRKYSLTATLKECSTRSASSSSPTGRRHMAGPRACYPRFPPTRPLRQQNDYMRHEHGCHQPSEGQEG
eukprot:286924-Prorocentrum_minimum.AAC.1